MALSSKTRPSAPRAYGLTVQLGIPHAREDKDVAWGAGQEKGTEGSAISQLRSRIKQDMSGCSGRHRQGVAHVPASPTTRRSGWLSSSLRNPARTDHWTSTIRTPTGGGTTRHRCPPVCTA